MKFNPYEVTRLAWIALGVVWLAGSAFVKTPVRTQSLRGRVLQSVPALIACVLLTGYLIPRWMAAPFLPLTPALQLAGAALTVAGCLFAVWARITLGSNWSSRVTVKAGHELIVKEPYAIVRHPIYTGILTSVAGTAMLLDHWRCIIGFVLVVVTFSLKMRQEERMMMETFPEQYPAYRKRVKALIPGIY